MRRGRFSLRRKVDDARQRFIERIAGRLRRFHERHALGEVGIRVHLQDVRLVAPQSDVDARIVAALRRLIRRDGHFLDLAEQRLGERCRAERVDLVIDFLQRVPLRRIADDGGIALRQLAEVELDGGQNLRRLVPPDGDVQFAALDELLDENGPEFLIHVVGAVGERLGFADDRILVDAGARVGPRRLDDDREPQPEAARQFRLVEQLEARRRDPVVL